MHHESGRLREGLPIVLGLVATGDPHRDRTPAPLGGVESTLALLIQHNLSAAGSSSLSGHARQTHSGAAAADGRQHARDSAAYIHGVLLLLRARFVLAGVDLAVDVLVEVVLQVLGHGKITTKYLTALMEQELNCMHLP